MKCLIYFHSNDALPKANGRKGKTKYNFYEDIVEQMQIANPDALVFVGKNSASYQNEIIKGIKKNGVDEVVVSGWSDGGNYAVNMTAKLYEQFPNLKIHLLLIDSNHTDNCATKVWDTLDKHNQSIDYLSNLISKEKNRKLVKIMKYKLPINYLRLKVPATIRVSKHRYCRDSALEDNVYGYLIGGELDMSRYTKLHYDYDKKAIVNG